MGMTPDEAYMTSWFDYTLMMYAYGLRKQDELEHDVFFAWLTAREVVRQDKKGMYVYKSYNDILDKLQSNEIDRSKMNRLYERYERLKALEKGG